MIDSPRVLRRGKVKTWVFLSSFTVALIVLITLNVLPETITIIINRPSLSQYLDVSNSSNLQCTCSSPNIAPPTIITNLYGGPKRAVGYCRSDDAPCLSPYPPFPMYTLLSPCDSFLNSTYLTPGEQLYAWCNSTEAMPEICSDLDNFDAIGHNVEILAVMCQSLIGIGVGLSDRLYSTTITTPYLLSNDQLTSVFTQLSNDLFGESSFRANSLQNFGSLFATVTPSLAESTGWVTFLFSCFSTDISQLYNTSFVVIPPYYNVPPDCELIYDSFNTNYLSNVFIDFSYENYFAECAPSSCTYVTTQRLPLVKIVSVVLGLIGGIATVLLHGVDILINIFMSADENDTSPSKTKRNVELQQRSPSSDPSSDHRDDEDEQLLDA